MSVAAVGHPAQQPARSGSEAVGASVSWRSPGVLLAGALLLLGLVGFAHTWFVRQHLFSMDRPEDWAHAYLVPFISAYIIYRRREALAKVAPAVFWPGLIPILVGIVSYAFFTLTAAPGVHMFAGFALVLIIAGVALLLLGPRLFQGLAAPLAYLAFGVTIAEMVMLEITWRLQQLAAWGAYFFLNIIQIRTEMMGNTLTIFTGDGREIPLNVAEACSGMRMLIAFLALAVAVALLLCPRWWQRVALVLLAVPVALVTNILRVALLGVLSIVNPELAAGEAHTLIGTLWLIPAFLLFMSVVWALHKLDGGAAADKSPATAQAKPAKITLAGDAS